MTGYILQFIAMASFGLSNCLWTFPLKRMPVSLLITIRAAITSFLFLTIIILQSFFRFHGLEPFFLPLSTVSFPDILLSVGICSISYFGLFFFNKAIKYGQVSISITVLCLGTMISILAGVFFYWEHFSYAKVLTGILFIGGLWCMEKLKKSMWKLHFSKGVYFSMLATLFWGMSAFYPVAIKKLGVLNFSFVLELTVFSISLFSFILQHKSFRAIRNYPIRANFHWIIKLALCGFCGVLFTNLAFQYLPLSTLGLLAIIQPVVSICFATYILKERLAFIQYLGVVVILFGVWISRN